MNKIVLFIICNLLLVYTSIAESFSDSTEVFNLDDLIKMNFDELLDVKVSVGSNIERLPMRDIPASVYTITSQQIKLSGARHLGELLQYYVPGFMWVTDEDDYIFGFRGLVADNNALIALLINGQNVNYTHSMGSGSMAGLLDLNYIDHVEILTGPGSAELGSGPLTAVINVVTSNFPKESSSYVEVGNKMGTRRFNNLDFGYYCLNDNYKLNVHFASFHHTDGFKPLKGNDKWVIPQTVLEDGKYFDQKPGHSLFVNFQKDSTYISFFNTKNQQDPYVIGVETFQVYETMGGNIRSHFALGSKTQLISSHEAKFIGFLERMHFQEPGKVSHAGEIQLAEKLAFQFDLAKTTILTGADVNLFRYGRNPFTGQNITWMADYPSIANQDLSTIIVDSIPMYGKYQPDIFAVDAGIFLETKYEINENQSLLASLRFSYNDVHNSKNLSPRLAYLGQKNFFGWKLFYTRAYRTPVPGTNKDIPIGGWFRHYYNPDLKDQFIDDFEFNFYYSRKHFFSEIRLFYAINRNILQGGGIALAVDDRSDPRNEHFWWTWRNSGDINSTGSEIFLRYRLLNNKLELGGSHAIVKVMKTNLNYDGDLFVSTNKKKFLNYPENVTRLHFTYIPVTKLVLHSDMLFDYGRFKGDPEFNPEYPDYESVDNIISDPWYNVNIGLLYKPFEFLECSFHVFNLLNSRPYWPVVFANDASVAAPHRSFTLGIRYRISSNY